MMEFEFDKEIDFLLRQTARGEVVSAAENSKSAHLDADEIAAIAENALPEKVRVHYIRHLADCERCRKNLSNLIALNADAPSEIVHAKEKQSLTETAPEIPWYRKLFAAPNLALAMGALVLLFSGIGIYTVLQSGSRSAEVSQSYEKQTGGRGMSSDGDAATAETFSANSNSAMANMAAMNTTANTSSNSVSSASNSAILPMPLTATNSNAMALNREADKDSKLAAKPAETRNEPLDLAKTQDSSAPPPAPSAPLKEVRSENETQAQQPNIAPQQNVVTQNQQNQMTQIMPDSRNAQRAPAGALSSQNKARKNEEAKDDAREKSANTTTVVGGKTFRRENGVWYDATYRGQATTNISRGTKEYRKLDADLRQIVERIGGTVVIVWKEKAYRIQ